MIWIRFVVLALIFISFAVAFGATIKVAYFKHDITAIGQSGTSTVTLWDMSTGVIHSTDDNGNTIDTPPSPSVRFNYARCSEIRSHFRAMQAFAIAGTVFGFYAFLASGLQTFKRLRVRGPLFVLTFLAFFSELLLVALAATAYSKAFCKGKNEALTPFKSYYSISMGFYLAAGACAGYFVTLLPIFFSQDRWCSKV